MVLWKIFEPIVQCKGQKKLQWFFQADVSSKKQTNEFYFTTMKPQVYLFWFVFWRKLKTPKRHFEIIWPLVRYEVRQNAFKLFFGNFMVKLQIFSATFTMFITLWKNASHSFVRLYKTSKVSITHILLFEFSKRSQLYLGNLSFQYVNCKNIQ